MNARRAFSLLPLLIVLAFLLAAPCRLLAQPEVMGFPIERETDVVRLLTLLKDKQWQTREESAQRLGELKAKQAVDPLIGLLRDNEQLVREAAARSLGKIGNPRGIEPIIAALKVEKTGQGKETMLYSLGDFKGLRAQEGVLWVLRTPDQRARGTAARVLVDNFWKNDIDALIKALQNQPLELRMAAADRLGMLADLRAIEPLIAAIHAYDKQPNWQAADALSRGGNYGSIAFPRLLAALQQTKDPERRVGVAWALAESRDIRVITPMLAAMDAADPLLRQKAAEALSLNFSAEPRVIEKLLPLLKDSNPDMRANMAKYLGWNQRDPRILDAILLLVNDPNAKVRAEVANNLERWEDPRTFDALLKLRKDPDKDVSFYAEANGLGNVHYAFLTATLLAMLQSTDVPTRTLAYNLLGKTDEPKTVELLLAGLKDAEPRIRAQAIAGLIRLRDPIAFDCLLAALKDPDPSVRAQAALALGELGDLHAVAPLIDLLQDMNKANPTDSRFLMGGGEWLGTVRANAVLALGQLGDVQAIEPLAKLLKADADVQVRVVAVRALGTIDDERTIAPLIAALQDHASYSGARFAPNEPIAVFAIRALAKKPFEKTQRALVTCLADRDEKVQAAAAVVLWSHNDERAIKPLLAGGIQRNPFDSPITIDTHGDPRFIEPLTELLHGKDFQKKLRAIELLTGIPDKQAAEALASALGDKNPDIRSAALKALAKRHDPRAYEPLIAQMASGKDELQRAAANALGDLGDARAIAPLYAVFAKVAAGEYYQKILYAKVLIRLGDADPLDYLLRLLQDPDTQKRGAACEVLGEVDNPRVLAALRAQLQHPLLVSDRLMLRNALLKHKDPAVIALLAEEIALPDTGNSTWVIGQLSELGAPAVDPLLAALKDARPSVREAAVRALGQLGDARAIDLLQAACSDPAPRVRRQATEALEMIRKNNQPAEEPH